MGATETDVAPPRAATPARCSASTRLSQRGMGWRVKEDARLKIVFGKVSFRVGAGVNNFQLARHKVPEMRMRIGSCVLSFPGGDMRKVYL